ncbi:U1 small nuclear ribonucleoprotein 70 kDa [Galdieria sulphuraria]|uniref:U1 small nuclear ribonucleoprotein 70kDa n=1 Tax=Galdieria sulphuraria TaxID=130081 RepID=M2XSC9_GALSU|nr:U1 small nuclear ribonucleoprotein 70kDa [Galdieria sulphuraria]EME26578.1 U1 small nuclear ribonucleoprotein 70kDa [Galdieria sulphuraria]GJD07383.1 U1 small nuclear ribonucleoprotein 70 kDa [Galdieria sulphuraria]|eukprot:XP_005703098.1 U1 small nuclear ribonucleoprotein 70kDa [Galdieria sulphuraria]
MTTMQGGPRPRQGLPRYQMPEAVMELFRPREPLPYIPPPKKRKLRPLVGVAPLLDQISQYKQQVNRPRWEENGETFETPAMRRERKRKEKREKFLQWKQKLWEQYSPPSEPNATSDAQKTLFIARLKPETTQLKLQAELEAFGKVKEIKLPISQKTGLPKGYAFVEFQKERDMREALRALEGKRIDGARVIVDVEKARTTKNWLPKKLRTETVEDRDTKADKMKTVSPPPSIKERHSSPPRRVRGFRPNHSDRYRRNRS